MTWIDLDHGVWEWVLFGAAIAVLIAIKVLVGRKRRSP